MKQVTTTAAARRQRGYDETSSDASSVSQARERPLTKSERKEIEIQAKFEKLQDRRVAMRKSMQERME